MDFLTSLFCESPFRLGIFCFILFAVVLFRWQHIESPTRRRWAFPATFGVIIALFLIQSFVVTEREEILQRLDDFVDAVVREDLPVATGFISEAYDFDGLDRDGFVADMEAWFNVVDVRDPRFHRRDVEPVDGRASMKLSVSATVQFERKAGETHMGVWQIDWRREADDWRIVAVRPESIDMQPISSMRGLRNVGR